MNTAAEFFKEITSIGFWEGIFLTYKSIGPIAGALFAMVESFIPALPLIAITALNVSAYGPIAGFIATYAGSCLGCMITFLFFRFIFKRLTDKVGVGRKRVEKARNWIARFDYAALFLLLCLPFTPSSFMNFAFGISDYPIKKYIAVLCAAKLVMIGSLAYFGDSLLDYSDHPLNFIIGICVMIILYILSVIFRKRHNLK